MIIIIIPTSILCKICVNLDTRDIKSFAHSKCIINTAADNDDSVLGSQCLQ